MIPYFWVLLWENRRNVFWRVDLFFSAVLAAVISVCVDDYTLQERYQLILSTTGAATIGLLGLTLAGLALLVAHVNENLLRISQKIGRGVIEDYFPFSLTASVAVSTALVSLSMLAVTPNDNVLVMRIGAGVSIGLFSWTLFHILSLVRNLAQHGINRALLASADDETKREPDAVGEDDAGA